MFAGRRNVLLLALSQALTLSAVVMSVTLGAMLGGVLAPDKGYATLPIAMMVIGTAIASIPAAILMRHHGRRAGFLIGAALGLSGSPLCALALISQVRLKPVTVAAAGDARPLRQILGQPALQVSILGSAPSVMP